MTVLLEAEMNCPLEVSGKLLQIAAIPEKLEHFWDIEHPHLVISSLQHRQHIPDLLTFWQRLPDTTPKFHFPMEWDNVAAIPIATYDRWINQQIHQNTRNKIRKAEKKGIDVRVVAFDDALIAGIVKVFAEQPVRQGRRFAHYNEGFETVKSEWSADLNKSTFLGAYYDDELVGFIKLIETGRYWRTSGTISMIKHRDKAPMNALIAKAVELCAERQRPFLVYGKFVYGNKGPDGLTEFKRHNGFQQFNVPRYYIPLTSRGRLALALGLHKPLVQLIPKPVMRALLKIREVAAPQVAGLGRSGAHRNIEQRHEQRS